MKKTIIFASLLTLLLPQFAYAKVTPTVTDTPSPTVASKSADTNLIDQQINKLKDQIASRVAQLKLVEKRGVIGTVTEVSGNQITISNIQGNTEIVQVDELTKFSSPNSKTFGLSDIAKGNMIGILGLYNKEAHQILARFIDAVSFPQVISGVIVSIDKKNYLLHLATPSQSDIPVDIETFSKMYSYTKADGRQKIGFSKLTENTRISVIGFYDKNNKTHILASRLITFPDTPANPKIALPTSATASSSATPSLPPSTGSGKKLYPLPAK